MVKGSGWGEGGGGTKNVKVLLFIFLCSVAEFCGRKSKCRGIGGSAGDL